MSAGGEHVSSGSQLACRSNIDMSRVRCDQTDRMCLIQYVPDSPIFAIPTLNRLCRWSEVVTHVPCGGNPTYPAGRLLISCMLKAIDGSGGTFGAAGPTDVWQTCPTISLLGVIMFDIADIEDMEDNGTFEGIVLHEMGHVIGVG